MKTILLIEDNKIMRENTMEILELSKHHVITAENGRVGVELATRNHPDLIICDIAMPEMDGTQVLQKLNSLNSTRNIPFIFLTALSEKAQISNGLEIGAKEYIVKPYMGDELLKAVSKYLSNNH